MIFLLVLCLMHAIRICPETQGPVTIPIPPNFSGNIHLHFTTTPHMPITINASSGATNTLQNQTVVSTQYSVLETLKSDTSRYTASIYEFINTVTEHKWLALLGGIACAYTLLFGQLIYLGMYVTSNQQWCTWQNHVPLELMITRPREEMCAELLLAIQQHYHTVHAPTDFLTPLTLFLKDVTREIRTLSYFLKLHSYLCVFKIPKLFPEQKSLIKKAEEKLKRVQFLKELFIRWSAEYKIAMHVAH